MKRLNGIADVEEAGDGFKRPEAGGYVCRITDVEDNPELAEAYGIMNVPAVLFFKDGNQIDRCTGALPKKKIRWGL